MVIILSILVGAVLGTRYKVLCLIPTTAVGIAAVAAFGLIGSTPLASTLQTAITVSIALQLGYVFGLAVRSVIVAARVPIAAPKSFREQTARFD
jgi:hypothetical protein